MPVQLLSIARTALVEGLRQPVFLLLVLLSGVLQYFTTWSTGFTMGMEDSSEAAGDNKLLLDIAMASVFVLGTILAAFVATSVVSREIENKTVLTVVSKPVSRTVLILGKFLGVSGALLLAIAIMIVFVLLGLRHGVMTTAADEIDGPVMLFGVGSVFLSLAIATWCNFYYGWSFPQTSIIVMAPLCIAAYIAVLFVGKNWTWQDPTKDIKPQVMMACASLTVALFVLTALATALSTRLSQVMTIVISAAVLVVSMMSNFFLGRAAFINTPVATIESATPDDPTKPSFDRSGATYNLKLGTAPRVDFKVGDPLYYGWAPNGSGMRVEDFAPFKGNLADERTYLGSGAPSSITVTRVDGPRTLTIRNLGEHPVRVEGPPQAGDFVFQTPTRHSPAHYIAWAVLPNMQNFWLIDAVSQNQRIPPQHLLLIVAYGAVQIVEYLALGVILFQRRDVG